MNPNGNIMTTAQDQSQILRPLFYREKIVTLEALKKALGTTAKMTVFRKLKTLAYRASYSHAGKYYTLDEIAKYDQHGIWCYRQVYFSKHGTLLNTADTFVCASETGLFANELQKLLNVRVQNALLQLVVSGRIHREELAPGYLYLSPQNWELQLALRKKMLEAAATAHIQPQEMAFDKPEIKRCLDTFLTTLNEKQRRLYAGFESMKLGRGGDTILSRVTGINVKTIARGRHELLSHQITVERVRQMGGGRPRVEKKAPS